MDHTQFLCIIQDFKRGMVVGAREFQKLLIYGDFPYNHCLTGVLSKNALLMPGQILS